MIDLTCPVCRYPSRHDECINEVGMTDCICPKCHVKLRIVLVPISLDISDGVQEGGTAVCSPAEAR